MRNLSNILLVIPHSGLLIPEEIPLSKIRIRAIHKVFKDTISDRYTDHLYDFADMSKIIFKWHRLFVDVNRHPVQEDFILPSRISGIKVFNNWNPDNKFKHKMASKYYWPFHSQIEKSKKNFILECHSTEKGLLDNSKIRVKKTVYLCDGQNASPIEKEPRTEIKTAPPGLVEEYANQIQKIDKQISVGINEAYYTTYGVIMDWNGMIDGRIFGTYRVPLILQETDESYYINYKNDYVNCRALSHLNRVFAESLIKTLTKFKII
jgi:hypothetical protein